MGKTPAGIMIRTLTAADLTAVSSIDEKETSYEKCCAPPLFDL